MAALKQLRRMEVEAVVADGASDALAAIAKSAGDMGKAVQQAGQAVEQTDRRVSQSKTAFERTRDSVDKLGAAARQLAREKEKINAAFDSGKMTDDSGKVMAVNAALAERNKLLALAEQKYQDIAKRAAAARAAESPVSSSRSGALSTPLSNDNRALAAANDNLSRSFGGLSSAAADALGALGPVGMAMQGAGRAATGSIAGLAGLTAAVGALSVAAIKAVQDQERLMGVFTQATGDVGKAAQEYAFVRAESDRLGLSFAETASQYAKLAAASRDTALEGQATRDIFTGMAEAATALKMSGEETSGALNAIQQMISKGKVQAEELRGQLGERLPGAFQIAARAMGVTTMELDAMLQKGSVMADDFLPKLATELHRTFGGQAAKNADGLTASFNRLDTAVADVKRSVGDGGLATAVGDVAKQLTTLSKESNGAAVSLGATLGNAVRSAGDGARYLYEHADAVKTALVGLAAAKGAVVFLELATAIQAAGGAMGILNAVMAANPFALAALAVGALAAGLYQHWQRSKDAEEAQRTLAAATEDVKRINALSSQEIAAQSAELQANTLATAKNAEAKLAMADAEAQSAALRGRAQLDELRAEQARRVQNPASIMSSSSASSPVLIQQAERRVADLDVAAARARKSLDDAQDALGKFGQTSAKTAPAVNATAIAANRSAQILGTYKDSVKRLYPLEDALVERNKKRADILVALDAGVTGFTQAQKDLAAVEADYKTRVESITHADRDREKAASEAEKEAERTQQQREKAIASVGDQIDKLKDETAQLGMTERERFVHNAALKAEKTLRDGLVSGADDYVTAVKKEAGALFDRAKAEEAATEAQEKAKKASEESAKHQAKIAGKATDDIVRYAGDTFADLFANTKGGWREVWNDMAQTARSTLARIAAEMLLRPIIAPIVQGVMGVGATAASGVTGAVGASNISGGNLLSLSSKFIPSSWTSGITGAIDAWGANTLGIGVASQMPNTVLTASNGLLTGGGATSVIPGEVAAGTGLTSYLGPLGIGSALGGLLGPLLANGNKAVGGLVGAGSGAAAGALAGTFLFPGVGTLLGGLLGGAGGGLGGLLGTQKPTVGPNAQGNVVVENGRFVEGPSAADNGGDVGPVKQATAQIAAQFNALIDAFGLKTTGQNFGFFTGGDKVTGNGVKSVDDLVKAITAGGVTGTGLVGQALQSDKVKSLVNAQDIAGYLQLAKSIEDATAGLASLDKSLAGIAASAKKAAADTYKAVDDELAKAGDIGLGDQYKAALAGQIRSTFEGAAQSWTPMETAMAQVRGQTDALVEAVGRWGLAITEGEVRADAAAKVAALRKQALTEYDAALATAQGRDYLTQLSAIRDSEDTVKRNLAAVGVVDAANKAATLVAEQAKSVLKGLDSAQLADVAATLTGSMHDLAAGMLTAANNATALAVAAANENARRGGQIAIETAINPAWRPNLDARLSTAGLSGGAIDALRPTFQAVLDAARVGSTSAAQMRGALAALDEQLRLGTVTTDQHSAAVSVLTAAWSDSASAATAAATAASDAAAATLAATAATASAIKQIQLDNANATIASLNEQSNAATTLKGQWQQVVSSVSQFRAGLLTGDLSPLNPEERKDEALRQFHEALAKAKGGDVDAAGQVQALAQTALQAAKAYDASSVAYANVFADVTSGLTGVESVGARQVSLAAGQLATLQQELGVQQAILQALQKPAQTDVASVLAGLNAGNLGDLVQWGRRAGADTLFQVLNTADQKLGGGNSYRYQAPADVQSVFDRQSSADFASVMASLGYTGSLDQANAWVVAYGKQAAFEAAERDWARGHGLPGFAAGGVVPYLPGSTPGQDSVLAKLMPFEGVVNLRGMGVLGSDGLAALNAGRWPANDQTDGGATILAFRPPAPPPVNRDETLEELRQLRRTIDRMAAMLGDQGADQLDVQRDIAASSRAAAAGGQRRVL